MPENTACRECANCCHHCIFLEYFPEEQIAGCLIYKNKFRVPLGSYCTKEEFMGRVEFLSGNDTNQTCHNFICQSASKSEIERSIKKDEKIREYFIKEWEEIKEKRKKIPGFNTLIEILNTEVIVPELVEMYSFLKDELSSYIKLLDTEMQHSNDRMNHFIHSFSLFASIHLDFPQYFYSSLDAIPYPEQIRYLKLSPAE